MLPTQVKILSAQTKSDKLQEQQNSTIFNELNQQQVETHQMSQQKENKFEILLMIFFNSSMCDFIRLKTPTLDCLHTVTEEYLQICARNNSEK